MSRMPFVTTGRTSQQGAELPNEQLVYSPNVPAKGDLIETCMGGEQMMHFLQFDLTYCNPQYCARQACMRLTLTTVATCTLSMIEEQANMSRPQTYAEVNFASCSCKSGC